MHWTKKTIASYKQMGFLLASFFVALLVRILIGGHDIKSSAMAGLVFGAILLAVSLAVGVKFTINPKAVAIGIIGGLALCLPILLKLGSAGQHRPAGNYIEWLIIVAFVAGAEELFLRGSLYDRVTGRWNESTAILLAAILFTVLHLPLYGLSSAPLDFAVGCFLGSLKAISRSVTSPLLAHIIADGAGWWIL